MAQKHIRVLQGFTNYTDSEIVHQANAAIAGMTGNKDFPSPPIELPVLQAALANFTAAITATAQGGPTATADKNDKRAVLVKYLRKEASYVQTHCEDNLNTLLSSGFQAAPTSRAVSPLPKPVITSVVNGHTTELRVIAESIRNAVSYDGEAAAIAAGGALGEYRSGGSFTSARKILLKGLTPGTTYSIRVRALGAAGYSDWSDPVSHMCM